MTPKVMDLVLSMKMMGLMINMMNCTGVSPAIADLLIPEFGRGVAACWSVFGERWGGWPGRRAMGFKLGRHPRVCYPVAPSRPYRS